MNFEYVAFYPRTPKNRWKPKFVGTVHFYMPDLGIDIRGVLVSLAGTSVNFQFPHFKDVKADGSPVNYPYLRFRNPELQKEMMNFLHQVAKPRIRIYLGIIKSSPAESK